MSKLEIKPRVSKDKTAYKANLVKEIAMKADIPVVQAAFIYDVMLDVIYNTLKKGIGVILPHIGSLKLVEHKSMKSNMTGQTIPKHLRLKFKPNVRLARFVRVVTREYKIK
jgi:nucleoid DNA-binding protein